MAEAVLKQVAELLHRAEAAPSIEEQIVLLEQVIALVSALTEWPGDMPREVWLALIRHSLGKKYLSRASDDRGTDFDRAIEKFEAVQQALDPQNFNAAIESTTWIENQDALGRAYLGRINGERQQNLKKASEAFESLRTILDPQNTREAWAALMSNLGYVYSQLDLGDRQHNIEVAIADLAAAETVLTKEKYPDAWAVNQSNLSEALADRDIGGRAENLLKAMAANEAAQTVFVRGVDPRWTINESTRGKNLLALAELQRQAPEAKDEAVQNTLKAITALETARKFMRREDNPHAWASLQFALANAYREHVAGAPDDSERCAIDLYDDFLATAPREEGSTRWADANASMAHLLLGAQFRDDAKNVEKAIRSLNAAATVFTRADYLDGWAQLQAGLGIAYFVRLDGDRAENLERSIKYYETALDVLKPESMVPKWGDVQNNLGGALFNRIDGDREVNLNRAVKAYRAALTVRTQERFPEAWAETQNNLATVYAAKSEGDRGKNIDAAISALHAAQGIFTRSGDPERWAKAELQIAHLLMQHPRDPADKIERAIASLRVCAEIYTRETHLREWALLESDLGGAYRNRYDGRRAENQEQSIAHYEAALSVLTREAEPDAWAHAMNGLGLTYTERIHGSRTENIDQALAAYDNAQSVHTRSTAPADWAMVQNNRGLALVKRGERESIDAAIRAYKDAIEVYDDQRSRHRWAEAQSNLGLALTLRISGARADNIEQSIAAFEAALEVTNPDEYPDFWATAEANLANAMLDRIHGVHADNIDKAIRQYQRALRVQTRERYPEDWARLQTSLAAAFRMRVWGNRAENLKDAITAYRRALTVLTPDAYPEPWAFASMNLGHAYRTQPGGNLEANVEKALAAYADAAKIYTREQDPKNWAILESNIGTAYLQLRSPAGYDQAQRHLESALSYIKTDVRPREHLLITHRLGNIAAARSDWSGALTHYEDAIATFRLLFGMGLDQADARDVIASSGSLFADAAFATAKLGDLRRALDLLEDGKARILSLSLHIDSLPLDADKRVRRDELVAEIQNAERSHSSMTGIQKTASLAEQAALRRELAELIRSSEATETAVAPESLDRFAQVLKEGQAVVVPVFTEEGGLVFVIRARGGTISLSSVDAPDLTSHTISEFTRGPEGPELGGWFEAYRANYLSGLAGQQKWQAWLDAIDGLRSTLWNLAGRAIVHGLATADVAPHSELILIPPGALGILPLGLAENPATGRRLMDDYVLTYAPNLAALIAVDERLRRSRSLAAPSLAAVINPTSDLTFAAIEGALIEAHFVPSDCTVLKGDKATVPAVLTALKGRTYWHFAGHGEFNWMDASAAGLLLKNGVLSVAALLQASDLGTPRLVVLSACETGLHDIVRTPDEFAGLPATFVRLGAVGVLSTLWKVADISTALLVSKFYDLHRSQLLPPARALKLAQEWIREASLQALREYAQTASPDLAGALTGDEPDQPPFAHPFFWGGFVLTGE